MTSPVLVTGGTGRLGRRVVRRLRDAGCEVRVLSRHIHESTDGYEFVIGDLRTGQRLEQATEGVSTIIHCASDRKGDAEATRNLVRAAARTGSPHLVYISIVGVGSVSFGYFKSKLASERIVAESRLPWTTLRVTQFYDFILDGAQKATWLPVVPVPAGFRVQPIDPDDVAARLVELALGKPAGRVPDMGGPEVTDAAQMIREYLKVTHRRRGVLPIRLPGLSAIRHGALIPKQTMPGVTAGRRTWKEFLTANPGS